MSHPVPPDEPLDDAARARVRAQVVAGLSADEAAGPTNRRWLVPVAAAVAVGAVVAGAVTLGGGGTGGAAPGPAGRATPTGDEPVGETTPSASASPPTTAVPPQGTPVVDLAGCDREVRAVLRGGGQAASIAAEDGASAFYVAGDRFAFCTINDGTVTVHHPKPIAGGGERNPYEISTDFLDGGDAALAAGGAVPPDSPDFTVTYTFPDGHVEQSLTIGAPPGGQWWIVLYRAADAMAATAAPPTVEVQDGPPATPLDVTDTCAQANHGC